MEELNRDQFLLAELSEGHERAFDFVFRQYYKPLCAQANIYLSDLDKSQSLVQECFIKLWENRSKANHIKNLSSYLSFMVRNRCIDYLRTVKPTDEISKSSLKNIAEANSEDIVMAHEFEERLVAALSLLPERSREAFEYSRFDGLSYREIAEKMGVSVKAVEALLGRALRILRKELKDYLPILIALYKISRF